MKKILVVVFLLSFALAPLSRARVVGDFEIPSKKVVMPQGAGTAPAASVGSGGNGSGTATAGSTWTEPNTGMEFVWVPGGCFEMGSNDGYSDEKPVHRVCVDGFWLGKYEVTQGQWQKIMGNNPSYFKKGDNYPVEEVSWNDCQDYIRKLNSRAGKDFRLPTEAEWEYAARSGGRDEKYAGGSDIDRLAWYSSNSGGSTHAVGGKAANGLGLYDMSGNVYEWCQDWYLYKKAGFLSSEQNYYKNSSTQNPTGPSSGSARVERGGCWNSSPRYLRSARRLRGRPDVRYYGLGFRLLLPPGRR